LLQRNQQAALAAAFDGPQTAFGIPAHLPGRTQLAEPDSFHLDDRRGDQSIIAGCEVPRLVQPCAQRPQPQRSELAVLQFGLPGA